MNPQNKYSSAHEAIADNIRLVKDFPAPGVVFEDLTPVLADAEAFHAIVTALVKVCRELGADFIGALDARGFLLGSAVAYELGVGVLAIRKRGKLPPPVHSVEYDLEYGTSALEIPADAWDIAGTRVVLIDDVLATGGTMAAAARLVRQEGAEVTGYAVVLEVAGLGGRAVLDDAPLVVINDLH
ncbi:PRPP-binding protein, adenine/guanine phosphoribosyltransferase [Corynebacterium uterequi]|uniref:Adenine phosphoribosyltransferase n=1 Tax=Corynebacterium uterequi TaxID=1072256 RepID=A0A0G3HJF0_9CORY|nr:adenine phosphoribosyltransferase [Corynebacterium uterequi]AKK11232.1 PRPP-binding protein, adenine/guanine phosphoribosyltransferase [Corynebacterium uterequi]